MELPPPSPAWFHPVHPRFGLALITSVLRIARHCLESLVGIPVLPISLPRSSKGVRALQDTSKPRSRLQSVVFTIQEILKTFRLVLGLRELLAVLQRAAGPRILSSRI